MKTRHIFYCTILLVLLFAACDNPQEKTSASTTTVDNFAAGPVCYISLAGLHSEDSSGLMLTRVDGSISGTLAHHPYQKDKRVGILMDVKQDGDIISANWKYQQEGITDTIPVSFKLNGRNILQQPNIFDPASGRETLDTNAGYTIAYTTTACNK